MIAARARRRVGLWGLAAALFLLACWHAVAPLGPLNRLEWAMADWRARQLAPSAPLTDIVIVDIDDASLAALGRWPWPRGRVAQLIDEVVQRQGARAVGLDLLFAEPDDGPLPALRAAAAGDAALSARLAQWEATLSPDQRLAAALRGRPIVLGYYLTQDRGTQRSGRLPDGLLPAPPQPPDLPRWNGWASNTDVLTQAAPSAGFFNAWPDGDGIVRSVPAVAWVDGQLRPSLALALAAQSAGARLTPQWLPSGRLPELVWRDASGARTLRLDEWGRMQVPYRAGAGGPQGGSHHYLSAHQLLAGTLAPGQLAGKTVLIGTSAPALADLRPTPGHPAMPGVEVHANLLAGILTGELPQRPDWAPGWGLVLSAALLLGVALLVTRLAPAPALAGSATLMAAALAANLLAHARLQLLLPVAAPLLLAGVLASLATAATAVAENRRRRALVRLFSRYMPAERAASLVEQAAEAPLEAHNAELTVLFCDLRGFTALAETLTPQALRELLNMFLSTVTQIIHAHHGTLDKFIGDAVMAFWGAPLPQPDHAAQAVAAAVALAEAQVPLNRELAARGLPPVAFGIGLATGLACVGDLGSRERSSYTAVGDTVNLAARIEALTRSHRHALLADSATRTAAGELPGLTWLPVAETTVRGRQQAVTLFTALPHTARAQSGRDAPALEQSPP